MMMDGEVVRGNNTAKADDVIIELVRANKVTIGEGMAMMIALERLAAENPETSNAGTEWIRRAKELVRIPG